MKICLKIIDDILNLYYEGKIKIEYANNKHYIQEKQLIIYPAMRNKNILNKKDEILISDRECLEAPSLIVKIIENSINH